MILDYSSISQYKSNWQPHSAPKSEHLWTGQHQIVAEHSGNPPFPMNYPNLFSPKLRGGNMTLLRTLGLVTNYQTDNAWSRTIAKSEKGVQKSKNDFYCEIQPQAVY